MDQYDLDEEGQHSDLPGFQVATALFEWPETTGWTTDQPFDGNVLAGHEYGLNIGTSPIIEIINRRRRSSRCAGR